MSGQFQSELPIFKTNRNTNWYVNNRCQDREKNSLPSIDSCPFLWTAHRFLPIEQKSRHSSRYSMEFQSISFFLILPKNICIGNWFHHIFKNSNLSYRMKGALNKPSFRRLFFSIQIPSLKSICSVLEAIAKEDFLHRLHTYRYPFCKGSSASPHRFCLGVLKYIEYSWEASGSVPSFLSCSYRKAGHSGEFGQNL